MSDQSRKIDASRRCMLTARTSLAVLGAPASTAGHAAFIIGQCLFRQRPASSSIDQVMEKVNASLKAR